MDLQKIKRLIRFMIGGRDSVFFLIEGFNQTGKTDFMLWLMEQFYKLKLFRGFGCNQPLEGAPFDYDYITSLDELMKKATVFNKRYFFFLDELGKSATRATPWEKLNIALIKEFETKRKYKLSVGACAIGQVDRRIKNPLHLDFYIRKLGLTTARIYHLQKRKTMFIPNIPKTNIGFKQYEAAIFTKEAPLEISSIDPDIQLAIDWSQGIPYTGNLVKSARYKHIRIGVSKMAKLLNNGEFASSPH